MTAWVAWMEPDPYPTQAYHLKAGGLRTICTGTPTRMMIG